MKKPLEIIKRIKVNNDVKFKVVEVYDIITNRCYNKKRRNIKKNI